MTSAKVVKTEQLPADDDATEEAPGVLRVQLPIALPGLGHVNCYALEDDKGWSVVDPGLPGPQSIKQLKARLARAGVDPKHIHTVVVTHSHPDHFGGAGTLAKGSGADIVTHADFRTWFSQAEGESVDDDEAETPFPVGGPGATTPWGGQRFQPSLRQRMIFRAMRVGGGRWFAPPTPTVRVVDGEEITIGKRQFVSLHTPGHTADHLCLFSPDDGLLLSGDHVLPTITPHISGLDSISDSLGAYFESLDRVASLDGVTTVLPAHGIPFTGVAERVTAIKEHHAERLDTLREASSNLGWATVEQLSKELFRPRSWGPMAESETYAHLEHLRLLGQAQSDEREGKLHFLAT